MIKYNSANLIRVDGRSTHYASVMMAVQEWTQDGEASQVVIRQDTNDGPQELEVNLVKGDRMFLVSGEGETVGVIHGSKKR